MIKRWDSPRVPIIDYNHQVPQVPLSIELIVYKSTCFCQNNGGTLPVGLLGISHCRQRQSEEYELCVKSNQECLCV